MAEEMTKMNISIPCPWVDLRNRYKQSEITCHVRGIRREVLLAVRSLIDARIEALSEANEAAGKERPKKVDVK